MVPGPGSAAPQHLGAGCQARPGLRRRRGPRAAAAAAAPPTPRAAAGVAAGGARQRKKAATNYSVTPAKQPQIREARVLEVGPLEAFRTSLQLFLGLPPNCLIGVRQCECGFRAEGAVLATHMLRCPTGPEVVGIHNLLRDALAGLMGDAGYRAVVEVNNIMPITTDAQGRHHRRTLDIVGVQPGGGPRALTVAAKCQ
eukprot:SM000319S12266  [mRNA]  locus=s319:40022:45605:+ [translate_table: standard]